MGYREIKQGFWCMECPFIDRKSIEASKPRQGLPAPKELTLQSCLLDRASMLMLQVVLPFALLLGPSNHQVWQGKEEWKRQNILLKPIHLRRERYCSPFKFNFSMSTSLLHVSFIWRLFMLKDLAKSMVIQGRPLKSTLPSQGNKALLRYY